MRTRVSCASSSARSAATPAMVQRRIRPRYVEPGGISTVISLPFPTPSTAPASCLVMGERLLRGKLMDDVSRAGGECDRPGSDAGDLIDHRAGAGDLAGGHQHELADHDEDGDA